MKYIRYDKSNNVMTAEEPFEVSNTAPPPSRSL